MPFLSLHGAQIRGIQVFPTIKITVIRQVGMYCGLSMKINMSETPTARDDHGRILLTFVSACVVGKNRNTPNLSPMADNAITRGGTVYEVWDLPCISVQNRSNFQSCSSFSFPQIIF